MRLPLSEFVKRTIEEITAELPSNYIVDDKIDFDVSFLINTDDKDNIQIMAVTDELGKETKSLHRVTFSVSRDGSNLSSKGVGKMFSKNKT